MARDSYGRLLALLAARSGDIVASEDALSAAFERALSTWPADGVPQNPTAWIFAVARNRLRDHVTSAASRTSMPLAEHDPPAFDDIDTDAIPDKRLALLFVCAHPAIDAAIRTPLMLQATFGFDARQVAQAFAVSPATMAQRLVRAKRRIRDTRIPFAVPERAEMPTRLPPVLEAIYGAYAIDWMLVSGPSPRDSLATEALSLASTLASLLAADRAEEPEAWGLAALIALSLARADARLVEHRHVPLEDQDVSRWNHELIARGETWLRRAHALDRVGRFQLEAAIQSAHCARAVTGQTDWAALLRLHEELVRIAPTLGARVALAATLGRLRGPLAGLAALDAIADDAVQRFQPAWATRGHLLAEAGRADAASAAFIKAISLTTDAALREHLRGRVEALVPQLLRHGPEDRLRVREEPHARDATQLRMLRP